MVYPLVPAGLPMLRVLKQHSKSYPARLDIPEPNVSFQESNFRLHGKDAERAIKKLKPLPPSDMAAHSTTSQIDLSSQQTPPAPEGPSTGDGVSPAAGVPSLPSQAVESDLISIPRSVLSSILDRVTQLQGRINAQHIRDQEAVARSSKTVTGYRELLDLAVDVAPDYPFTPAQPDFEDRKMTSKLNPKSTGKSTGRS